MLVAAAVVVCQVRVAAATGEVVLVGVVRVVGVWGGRVTVVLVSTTVVAVGKDSSTARMVAICHHISERARVRLRGSLVGSVHTLKVSTDAGLTSRHHQLFYGVSLRFVARLAFRV